MSISGDLENLYKVGAKFLPEMGNAMAEAANQVHATRENQESKFVRLEYDANPALEGEVAGGGMSAAFSGWSAFRDEVQNILKTNADILHKSGEALVLAADAYAIEDGYNSDDLAEAVEKVDGPKILDPLDPDEK